MNQDKKRTVIKILFDVDSLLTEVRQEAEGELDEDVQDLKGRVSDLRDKVDSN